MGKQAAPAMARGHFVIRFTVDEVTHRDGLYRAHLSAWDRKGYLSLGHTGVELFGELAGIFGDLTPADRAASLASALDAFSEALRSQESEE